MSKINYKKGDLVRVIDNSGSNILKKNSVWICVKTDGYWTHVQKKDGCTPIEYYAWRFIKASNIVEEYEIIESRII